MVFVADSIELIGRASTIVAMYIVSVMDKLIRITRDSQFQRLHCSF